MANNKRCTKLIRLSETIGCSLFNDFDINTFDSRMTGYTNKYVSDSAHWANTNPDRDNINFVTIVGHGHYELLQKQIVERKLGCASACRRASADSFIAMERKH